MADPRQIVPQLSAHTSPFRLLDERSIDPRALGAAIRTAVLASRIILLEHTPLERLNIRPNAISVHTLAAKFKAATLIDCMGAWSPAPVRPRKGQMLAVNAPDGFRLNTVVRAKEPLYRCAFYLRFERLCLVGALFVSHGALRAG